MATGFLLTRRTQALVVGALLFVLAGCSGDDTAQNSNSSSGQISANAANANVPIFGRPSAVPDDAPEILVRAVPTLSGTPTTTAAVGQLYSFQPTVTDPANRILSLSIQNKPKWAAFNTSTGLLSGTPSATDTGTDSNIVISANDGAASTALAPFAIHVTQTSMRRVTLAWTAPTENTNGAAVSDLAGYRIHYGTNPTELSHTIDIDNVGVQTYIIDNLTPGTWYFAVTAMNSDNVESNLSNIGKTTI